MSSRTLIAAICVVLSFGVVCSQTTGREEEPALERASPAQAPASVKGRFEEINIGKFDLVDGIAWPTDGAGTVVYVASKPIASSMLGSSACPATMARALVAVRDAGWVEVTLDAAGKSDYFGSGKPYGGSSREKEVGGETWSATLQKAEGRAAGNVKHKERGGFEFDLPLLQPEGQGGQRERPDAGPASGRVVPLADGTTDDRRLRRGARRGDEEGLERPPPGTRLRRDTVSRDPRAQRHRCRPGALRRRFLKPGPPGEIEARQGHGAVQGEGANSKGAKFINYYWFAPCQGKLVLYSVTENPQ